MGQKHHIVFRSHGGLDIERNFIYLCVSHHSDGKAAVHNNREFDLQLKRKIQEEYFELFDEESYTIPEIAQIINYRKRSLEKKMKSVPSRAGRYERENIVRFLMGGRLY